ncbi:hypothetical protein BFG60_3041 [Microcystis aeruginosa NIES-98]|nr:hypothetical protein BFG60_3041 [Microcystis aeruginosa NIES-98]
MEHYRRIRDRERTSQFQSLVGFKINWNFVVEGDYKERYGFQSLVGFKINWN